MSDDFRRRQEYKNLLLIWLAMVGITPCFIVLIYIAIDGVFPISIDKPIIPAATGEFWLLVVVVGCVLHGLVNSLLYRYNLQRMEHTTVEDVRRTLVSSLSNATTVSLWAVFLAYTIEYQYFFVFLLVGFVAALLLYPQRREIENAVIESEQ